GNLFSNAVKFQKSEILVDLSQDEGFARIDVRDDGEGIDSQLLPSVFEMFRQGDPLTTRRHGGLGIGLSLVKQLAETHGGRVAVRSDGLGKGAHFTVWLPIRQQNVAEKDDVPHSNVLAGLKVLIVDDDESLLDSFRDLLSLEDAEVTTAASVAI